MSAYPSLAPFVMKRPWLRNMLTPVANWYANAAGYRKLGLRYVPSSPGTFKILRRFLAHDWLRVSQTYWCCQVESWKYGYIMELA
jgi:hypothetical protein